MSSKISFKKMTLDQLFELESKYSTTLGSFIGFNKPKHLFRSASGKSVIATQIKRKKSKAGRKTESK